MENKKIFNITLIISFIFIYILNVLTVKTGSDFLLLGSGIKEILVQVDVFKLIAYFLARVPKLLSCFINSVVFIVFVLLVGKDKKNYLLKFFALFTSLPVFGYTVLGKGTSTEYLYLLTLVFLGLYLIDNKKSLVLVVILFLIAGFNSLDIISNLLIALYLLYLLSSLKDKHYIYLAVCFTLGKVINVLINKSIGTFSFLSNPLFWILFGCILASLIIKNILNENIKKYLCLVLIIISVVSLKIFKIDKISLGFLFVLTSILFKENISYIDTLNKEYINVCFMTILAITCFNYYYALIDNGYIFYQSKTREGYIQSQMDNGNTNLVVSEYNTKYLTSFNSLYLDEEIGNDKQNTINAYYAKYRGLNSIKTIDKKIFEKIYENALPSLVNIQDFGEYLTYLKDNNLSFMLNTSTLDDNTAIKLGEYIKQYLNVEDFGKKHNIIYGIGNNIVHSESNEEDLAYYVTNDEGFFIYICSLSETSDYSIISINDEKYSLDYDGIKVVTYDFNSQMILDSVVFTLDDDTLLANR